jgi:hypothetical protein
MGGEIGVVGYGTADGVAEWFVCWGRRYCTRFVHEVVHSCSWCFCIPRKLNRNVHLGRLFAALSAYG